MSQAMSHAMSQTMSQAMSPFVASFGFLTTIMAITALSADWSSGHVLVSCDSH